MKRLVSKQTLTVFSFVLISVFVLTGCPQKPGEFLYGPEDQRQTAQVVEPVPQPVPQPVQVKETPVMAQPSAPETPMMATESSTHTVVKGECLWVISGYNQVYNDPFQWPLIYKANRDKVKDPDLIYPGQVLKITRDNPTSEKDSAIKFAKTRGGWSLTDGKVLKYDEKRALWEE